MASFGLADEEAKRKIDAWMALVGLVFGLKLRDLLGCTTTVKGIARLEEVPRIAGGRARWAWGAIA